MRRDTARLIAIGCAAIMLTLVGVAAWLVLPLSAQVGFVALVLGPALLAVALSGAGRRPVDYIVAAALASLCIGVVFGIGNERSNHDNAPGVVMVGTTVIMSAVPLAGAALVGITLLTSRIAISRRQPDRPRLPR